MGGARLAKADQAVITQYIDVWFKWYLQPVISSSGRKRVVMCCGFSMWCGG